MYVTIFPKKDRPLVTSNLINIPPETIGNILVNNRLAKQKPTLIHAKMSSHYTDNKQQAI